jgi:hypothetical protein
MGTLIPFSSSKVPAYLAKLKAKGGGSLAAFSANVGGGFPVLHIKGKEFSVTRDGVRTQLQLPDADGELVPATYVDLVLLKANANLSKVYYAKGYEEGAANAKPDCLSNDGVRPDAAAATPQSKACASCPHNVFGTGAGGKGKACSDSRRVAVAASGTPNEPMLLRVPPASLKNLAEYARLLGEKGIPEMHCVVTRLKFESGESSPKLVFIPKGFLDDEAFALAEEAIESDIVQQILGLAPVPEEETAEPVAKPGKVAPTTVAKAVAAEPEEDEEDEADEEDEEETPPPPPVEETKKRGRPRKEPEAAAPAAKPATKPAKGALTEDSLKSLLGKIDDLAFDDI